MSHKIALVTGGTAGVGLSIVRALASNGVEVHFIGTSEEKGRRVEEELNETGDTVCRFIKLDLSNLRDVMDFATAFQSEVPQLDILANVAGVTLTERQETVEGIEKTIAIGHLSAFLLSRELAPLLSKAEHPRIMNVGGVLRFILKPRPDFDKTLDFTENYRGMRVAIDTVHAKTVLTAVFAERFASQGIDVNVFHPGAVKSDIGRDMPFPKSLFFKTANVFMAKTSKTGIYLATSDDVTGVTGQIFVGKKPIPLTFERPYRDALWTATEALVDRTLST
jgi:NAD(P)-dependent dehydrogenase (short-subunit alcohol dehydrogenase family)